VLNSYNIPLSKLRSKILRAAPKAELMKTKLCSVVSSSFMLANDPVNTAAHYLLWTTVMKTCKEWNRLNWLGLNLSERKSLVVRLAENS
jgi:hypothetical protein